MPSTLTYASVVSCGSVRIALTIAALNDLKVKACDIQNAYLTADCREKIWTRAGPEFGSEVGMIFIVRKSLYGLKSGGAVLCALLAETLHKMGYNPSKADPDVWLRPAVKSDGFEYYKLVLYYVNDVLSMSADPDEATLRGLQSVFKLKDDKIAEPAIYLGAQLEKWMWMAANVGRRRPRNMFLPRSATWRKHLRRRDFGCPISAILPSLLTTDQNLTRRVS